ncbi:MAG: hypothetical protein ACRD3J_24275 [Thermoanaerobaculia bacterium]
MAKKSIALDVAASLAAVALTVVFDFVHEALSDLQHLKEHPEKVLSVQFDLLLVSLTILFGAYVSTPKNDRGRLVPALFLSIFFVLGMLAAAAASRVWEWSGTGWLTVWMPDILGMISIVVAVNAARSVSAG